MEYYPHACDCGFVLRVRHEHAGRRIRCRACGRAFLTEPGYDLVEPTDPRPQNARRSSHGRGMIIGGAAFFVLLYVLARVGISGPPQTAKVVVPEEPLNDGLKPLWSSMIRPPTEETGCSSFSPDSFARPRTGEEVSTPQKSGYGELTVENGSSLDAVLVIRRDNDGRTFRRTYIRAQDADTIRQIPPGSYTVAFMSGADWLPRRWRFCRPAAATKFSDSFLFVVDTVSNQIRYSVFSISLQPVPEGTASTEPQDLEWFGSPPN